MDFSKLDLNTTLKELADRDETSVGDEITENDIMMPAFSIEPKFDSDITIVPKETDITPIVDNKESQEPIEENQITYSSMEQPDSMLKPVLIVLGVTFFFLLMILGIDYLMVG